ncbi:hypothetical protein [Micromonospora endophytica]|uniref:hypothetical protein n=1 Tax=Micromonospora endophytica TaxID=515350 RepID=UPI003B8386EE
MRDDDWPTIYPFFNQIVASGRTYAFPENLSLGRLAGGGWSLRLVVPSWRWTDRRSSAAPRWVPTGLVADRTWRRPVSWVLATVPEAFDHPEHGLVGLHVMFLDLRSSQLRR